MTADQRPMTVWIVTEGEYSDYRICRVFSTKELARAYANSVKRGTFDSIAVEEWPVNSTWDADEVYWLIRFYEGGELHSVYRLGDEEEKPPHLNCFKLVQNPGPYWEGTVRGRDMNHAIKIGAEQLAMTRALLAGMG